MLKLRPAQTFGHPDYLLQQQHSRLGTVSLRVNQKNNNECLRTCRDRKRIVKLKTDSDVTGRSRPQKGEDSHLNTI